ncbi:MAG TPA: Fe-S protein assembly chaperone HscA [Dongiaceae bacterium]|jgi:molecular chaperone HscA|nr:Fe-S protein assembly chaperone HscA [Dongiaceae bacterium]
MTNLLQIHEPGQTPAPHAEVEGLAVGIDLGTTNSLVAVVGNAGTPEILRDENGEALMPSVVAYLDDEVIVGSFAVDIARSQPRQVISSIKRLMGRGLAESQETPQGKRHVLSASSGGMVRVHVNDRVLSPIEISADILRALRHRAEQALSRSVDKAVITVPAYFDDGARAATKEAARLAGLQVLRLVNEPTAAALRYGLEKGAEGLYAIFDLGGGTFDISVLQLEKGVFRVRLTAGDTALGGDDIDQAILEWAQRRAALPLPGNEQEIALREARRAKEALSTLEETDLIVPRLGPLKLSRTQLEELAKPFLDRAITLCARLLLEGDIPAEVVKGVVLVGGSTRMPYVRRRVEDFFKKAPLTDIDPDLVVAEGAALQAHALTRGSDTLLLDVIPLSLGIETMGGIVEKIIDRNTPIPVAKAQDFTTYQDGQTRLMLHVVQGERETVAHTRSLARFELGNIPPMVAGAARIRVTFAVDADGLLTVSAEEKTTGASTSIEVQPSHGLTEEETIAMLRDSLDHAEEDMRSRLLAEAKVEAERILLAFASARRQDDVLLKDEERGKIAAAEEEVRRRLAGDDRDALLLATTAFEKATHDFAQRRMDRAIAEALQGQRLDDIEADMATARPSGEKNA